MLKDVCHHLAKNGWSVSVIARHQETLDALLREVSEYSGKIIPLVLDWNDLGALEHALLETIAANGPITLSVVWIHSSAPAAPLVVAKFVEGDYYHVRPSSVLESSYRDPVDVAALSAASKIRYHQVILGSIVEDGQTRWLTNHEIAVGVIEALEEKPTRFVVGN